MVGYAEWPRWAGMMIAVAVGRAQRQLRVDDAASLLGDRLVEGTVYALLARVGDRLFPDDYLADVYENSPKGRPTVPARTVAAVDAVADP